MNDEGRADLVTHLTELRARLLRCLVYAGLAMAAAWLLFDPLYRFLVGPVITPLHRYGGELTVRMLLEGILVRLEIVIVAGLIAASPLILYEVWAFVAPGLTPSERRASRPLVPVAMALFLMGVAMGYLITPLTVTMLLRFIPPNALALLTLNETVLLLLKFYLVFGLAFQLPIVIVLLAKLGLVDSRLLASRWREAMVAIFVLAALITPTDPFTMFIAAMPMVALYLGTIIVVKWMERAQRRARTGKEDAG